MPIQALLFDLDETLIPEGSAVRDALLSTCRIAQERYNLDPEALAQEVLKRAKRLWRSYPTSEECMALGISSWEGLHARFEGDSPLIKELRELAPTYRFKAWSGALEAFDVHDHRLAEELAEAFRLERARRYKPFPDAEPLLEGLQERYSLALVTNGPPCLQREKLLGSELEPFFREVVISGELGIGKPDPRIFERALSLLSVSPKEAVMIGNSLERDVAGAKRAGLIAVWVRRSESQNLTQDPELSPDAIISGLSELPKLLLELDMHHRPS